MSARPCYIDRALDTYLSIQQEAEVDSERLAAQTKVELSKRSTWELGASEANTYDPNLGTQIAELLMRGDTAQYGHLIHKYVVEVYAPEVARQAIEDQDKAAANAY